MISVRIGPKGLKPLRKGLHVDVLIYWGAGSSRCAPTPR